MALSRLGIPVNLPTGATYDILLVSTPKGYPEGPVVFQFETTPRKITGIQKVAQTFFRILFTSRGSDIIRPTIGTNFQELTVGANRVSGNDEFKLALSKAIRDAELQTAYILNGKGQDLSSQLEKIDLINLTTTNEALSLILKMTTKSGETASVAIPFPQLDLKLTNG